MNCLLLRILLAPRTALRYFVDRVVAPAHFRLNGVQTESGLRLSGLPMIRLAKSAQLIIGKNVMLASRPADNPLRILTPCSFSAIKPGAMIEIGDGSSFSGTVICAANHIRIGKRVMVGANCMLTDTDFHPLLPEQRQAHPTEGAVTRPVIIEDDVFIGTQAIVLKGTVIGAGSVVGACAVVAGKYPPRSLIVGNPAKVLRSLDEQILPPNALS